jgi:membrane protein required for colicin V production
MLSYDLVMLVVLLGCTVFGAWKGMAWQVASLGSLVVSYLAALRFSDRLAPVIGNEEPWNRVVAMLIIYCCTAIAVWMAFRVVAKVIDGVKLREFDRQLGALFGAAKGVLLCLVITFFAISLSETARGMVRTSRSGHYMALLLDRAHPLMPRGIHEVLHPYFDQLQQGLDPDARPEEKGPLDRPDGTALGNSQGEPSGPAKQPGLGELFGGQPDFFPSPPGIARTQERHEQPWRWSGGSQGRLPADSSSRPNDREEPPSGWDNFRSILDGIRELNELGRRGEAKR